MTLYLSAFIQGFIQGFVGLLMFVGFFAIVIGCGIIGAQVLSCIIKNDLP